MTRHTAVVKIEREDCPCGRPGTPHPRYVARCRDCGWEDIAHVRVILGAAGTGSVQRHRVSCPAMQGGAS